MGTGPFGEDAKDSQVGATPLFGHLAGQSSSQMWLGWP
jgi:hypothetical protein